MYLPSDEVEFKCLSPHFVIKCFQSLCEKVIVNIRIIFGPISDIDMWIRPDKHEIIYQTYKNQTHFEGYIILQSSEDTFYCTIFIIICENFLSTKMGRYTSNCALLP